MELQCNSFKVEINFVDIFGCTVVISRVNRLAIHFIFVTGFLTLSGESKWQMALKRTLDMVTSNTQHSLTTNLTCVATVL